VPVNVPGGEHRTAAFLAKNHWGTVPVLAAFAGLAFADFVGVSMPEDLDALRHWRDRVAARPSASHAWENPR